MNTKFINEKSIEVINQYTNFKIGKAVCSIPYYNNRHSGGRAKLRVEIGKGSPKEIFDEIEQLCVSQKININDFTNESLKKFLVDNDIGIDCSGYAYYVYNSLSQSLNKGSLDKNIKFTDSKGLLGKLRGMIRPVENTNVETLANNKNSKQIKISDIQVGDMITMLKNSGQGQRNHILIIYQVEYQNFKPIKIHYTHSIAWPSHGEYNHGVKNGTIEVIDSEKSIIDQRWIEDEKIGDENYTFSSAKNSITEIRRLNFLY